MIKRYKNQEDKPTYLLFYEYILKPILKSILKSIGIIGTAITRSFKDIFWTFAGLMVLNNYLETKIVINVFIKIIMILGVVIYNYYICKRSMTYY